MNTLKKFAEDRGLELIKFTTIGMVLFDKLPTDVPEELYLYKVTGANAIVQYIVTNSSYETICNTDNDLGLNIVEVCK